MSSMLGCGGILLRGSRLLLVGGGVEGSWQGMKESYMVLSVFAAEVKSHLMLIVEAYEVMYVVT